MQKPTTRTPQRFPLRLVAYGAGLTHAGIVRERNEDAILTDPSGTLWAVADGMGGHGRGDRASEIVIDRLAATPDGSAPLVELRAALMRANQEIQEVAQREGGGAVIGATVVAAMIVGARATVVWAGDSRAYLGRGMALEQISRDHTLVQELVDAGALSAETAHTHPDAHVVRRAVGAAPELDLDHVELDLYAGDRLLLCSDGLTGCVSDEDIRIQLATVEHPATACTVLTRLALSAGAPDNVSVICIFVEDR